MKSILWLVVLGSMFLLAVPCKALPASHQRIRFQFVTMSAFQLQFVYCAFGGASSRIKQGSTSFLLSRAFNDRVVTRNARKHTTFMNDQSILKFGTRLFSTTAPGEDIRIPASSIDTSSTSTDSGAPAVAVPRRFVPKPFQYHELVTIRIESLTNMGWGIGRVKLEPEPDTFEKSEETSAEEISETEPKKKEDDRLWVIMVPHVVVGELVSVRIFRNMKSYSEADLVDIIEPSDQRVTPKCSLAGVCGGCQYQHMHIDAQREWKTSHVHEVLRQQNISGHTDTEENNSLLAKELLLPTLGTEHVYGYRSKLTPHYQAPQEVEEGKFQMGEIGFQQSSNRNLVDVPHCPIATDAINEVYMQTRTKLQEDAAAGLLNSKTNQNIKKKKKKRGSRGGDTGATLLFRNADDDENGNPVVVTDHNEYVTTTVKGIKFRYKAGNFFQNNDFVVPLMVDSVLEAVMEPLPDGGKPSYLIDCYCGSGLFALSAASQITACIGIEVNAKAIEEATYNAELNDIGNCQFVAASAEAIFTSPPDLNNTAFTSCGLNHVQDLPRDQTVVVLDPPRKGCSEAFLEQLYAYQPQRIVYMSCGPATQARDAKGIVEVGGYEVTSIQPFDLFPQTKHVENLMVFEKKKS